MSRILIIGEHDGQHLNQSTARCVACAAAIDSKGIDIVILGADLKIIAAEAPE